MHGEIRLDDAVIMLSDCGEEWPAVESHVHVYVPDVDAAFRRAWQRRREVTTQAMSSANAAREEQAGGFAQT